MTIKELQTIVDVVIVAVRAQDELPELEKRFPVIERASGQREYSISRIARDDGKECVVALVMSAEGPASAQQVMNDVIEDLAPDLTLAVGIGGGVPHKDSLLTLGDVVMSSGGLDVTRGELLPGKKVWTKETPFRLHHNAKSLVDNLHVDDRSWNTPELIGIGRPAILQPIVPLKDSSPEWTKRGQDSLHLNESRTQPRLFKGTIASGGHFIKDELSGWEKTTKQSISLRVLSDPLLATDMETVGIYRASERNTRTFPWLSIRGISDITGLQRDRSWSPYAAATAASFCLAFIKSLSLLPRRLQRGLQQENVDSMPDAVALYLKTYLEPPPVQEPESSGTDPQLSSIMLTIIDRLQRAGDSATILDIGCGKGNLLQRLITDTEFGKRPNWVYIAVDDQENLDSIQKIARNARINRRVELVEFDSFYAEWPQSETPQLVVCRNLLHELTIVQTAQLLRHIADNIGTADVFICQDLMTFPQGERHNACWFHTEFQTCMREHGFERLQILPVASQEGTRWFNLIADGIPSDAPRLPADDSFRSVLMARQRQWQVWSQIDRTATTSSEPHWSQVVKIFDLDLQLAALTRQLRDAGAFVSLDADLDKRLRSREVAKAIAAFVSTGRLDRQLVSERVRLRERGEQLNLLENFLRGSSSLVAVTGGGGSGKTTLVEHLLATRSYDKSPVIVDAKQAPDLWSFIERVFAQVGLRVVPERLSLLQTLSWQTLEVPLRQFANRFSSRIILFIDNLAALMDSNGNIQDPDIVNALAVLGRAEGAKIIVAMRGQHIPEQLMHATKTLNPSIIRVGRYATDETVVNVLDDCFDRAAAGLTTYPQRLMQAIDRHPLAAMLTGEILHKHGRQILLNERFFLELEQKLHSELWYRLVDEHSIEAVEIAAELRVSVPHQMMNELVSPVAVSAALASAALYAAKDRRWNELIAALGVFRRRRLEEPMNQSGEKSKHQQIADHYLSIYRADDDPKWLRESYFHRMLAGGNQSILGTYYLRELVASANYCFLTQRDYQAALTLYDAAAQVTQLSEEARMHQCSCRIRVGQRPLGDRDFERLIEQYPTNLGMRTSFVDALLFVRDFSSAKQKLTELGLDPERSDWVAGQWGRAWMGLNEYAKAEAMFRKQLSAKPLADPPVFLNLAHALQYQGAVAEALLVLDRAQTLHPGNFQITAALGACLERLRRDDDALQMLEPLFESRPDYPALALTLIKIVGRHGESFRARQIFERARKHARDSSDSILVTAEAEVLKAEHRYEAAMQLLRERQVVDQHHLGMLLECWFHYAQSKLDSSERAHIAREALAEHIPPNLLHNIPLTINRSRLAALASDRMVFDRSLQVLQASRVERFEIDNLEQLWKANNVL